MTEFSYSLKKWKKSPQQFLFLTLVYSLYLFLLIIALALGEVILSDRPVWINYQGPLMTVGKKGIDDNLVPIASSDIAGLEQHPSVRSVDLLTRQQVKVRSHTNSSGTTQKQAILYSESASGLLHPKFSGPMKENYSERVMWVSKKFAQKHFGSTQVLDKVVYAGEALSPFVVKGLLEHNMDFVAGTEVDFWIPDTFGHEMFPLSLQLPDSMPLAEQEIMKAQLRKDLVKQIENQFAILRVFDNARLQDISADLSETTSNKITDGGFGVMTPGTGLKFWTLSGVAMTPKIDASLKQQFWIILLLVLMAGGLAALNKYAYATAQLIERKKEIAIRFVCGAQDTHLRTQFLLASLPLIFTIVICAGISLLSFYQFYANHHLVIALLGRPLSVPGVVSIALGFSIMLATILSSGLVPVLNLKKRSLFIRDYGNTDDKSQKKSRVVLLSVQVSIAFIAVFCLLLLFKQQYELTRLTNVNSELNESQIIKTVGRINNLFLSSLSQNQQSNIAFSANSFLDPQAFREPTYLQGNNASNAAHMSVIPVSENYFELLQADFRLTGELSATHVILNETAAKTLGLVDMDSVRDVVLSYGKDTVETLRVAGIVRDLPHYGMIQRFEPVIYTLYDNELTGTVFVLSTHGAIEAPLNDAEYQLEAMGTLEKQIKAFDFQFLSFITISMAVLIVLLLAILTSLYFQSKAMISSQSQLLGNLMSIGAKDKDVGVYILRFFSAPLTVMLLTSILCFVLAFIKLDIERWFIAVSMLSACIIVLSNVVLIIVLNVLRIRRVSIATLVRYQP